jgi:DNA-binding CsgD family transcriptional regulator
MRNALDPNGDIVLSKLPETVRVTLYNANCYFRKIDILESRYSVYSLWHNTMSKICTVDAFYVGFLAENNMVYYPYQWDSGEYADVDITVRYGPDGMCAWLIQNRRAYTYAQDNGRLLNRGQNFGDVTRVSQDAIVVPLYDRLDSERRVIGMASVQAYTPNSYQPSHVTAFQWMANQISQHLARAREDSATLQELDLNDFRNRAEMEGMPPAEQFTELLRRMHRGVVQAQQCARSENPEIQANLAGQLDGLKKLAEQLQTDWIDYVVTSSRASDGPERLWALLTDREQEAVRLATKKLPNQAIANDMGVSLTTVKTHLTNAFRKLGIKQRAELYYMFGDGRPKQASPSSADE